MRNVGILLAGVVVVCCSCASIDSPPHHVPLTADRAAVAGCSFEGFVQSHNAYASRSEVESELSEEAVDHGGNVVLLLTNAAGEAYSCTEPGATAPTGSYVPAEMSHRPPSFCPSFYPFD